MTGLICDSLRRNALGDVWCGNEIRTPVDERDGALIERAVVSLPPADRKMITLAYIQEATRGEICARLGIRRHPIGNFEARFAAAQRAVESASLDAAANVAQSRSRMATVPAS